MSLFIEVLKLFAPINVALWTRTRSSIGVFEFVVEIFKETFDTTVSFLLTAWSALAPDVM